MLDKRTINTQLWTVVKMINRTDTAINHRQAINGMVIVVTVVGMDQLRRR